MLDRSPNRSPDPRSDEVQGEQDLQLSHEHQRPLRVTINDVTREELCALLRAAGISFERPSLIDCEEAAPGSEDPSTDEMASSEDDEDTFGLRTGKNRGTDETEQTIAELTASFCAGDLPNLIALLGGLSSDEEFALGATRGWEVGGGAPRPRPYTELQLANEDIGTAATGLIISARRYAEEGNRISVTVEWQEQFLASAFSRPDRWEALSDLAFALDGDPRAATPWLHPRLSCESMGEEPISESLLREPHLARHPALQVEALGADRNDVMMRAANMCSYIMRDAAALPPTVIESEGRGIECLPQLFAKARADRSEGQPIFVSYRDRFGDAVVLAVSETASLETLQEDAAVLGALKEQLKVRDPGKALFSPGELCIQRATATEVQDSAAAVLGLFPFETATECLNCVLAGDEFDHEVLFRLVKSPTALRVGTSTAVVFRGSGINSERQSGEVMVDPFVFVEPLDRRSLPSLSFFPHLPRGFGFSSTDLALRLAELTEEADGSDLRIVWPHLGAELSRRELEVQWKQHAEITSKVGGAEKESKEPQFFATERVAPPSDAKVITWPIRLSPSQAQTAG